VYYGRYISRALHHSSFSLYERLLRSLLYLPLLHLLLLRLLLLDSVVMLYYLGSHRVQREDYIQKSKAYEKIFEDQFLIIIFVLGNVCIQYFGGR